MFCSSCWVRKTSSPPSTPGRPRPSRPRWAASRGRHWASSPASRAATSCRRPGWWAGREAATTPTTWPAWPPSSASSPCSCPLRGKVWPALTSWLTRLSLTCLTSSLLPPSPPGRSWRSASPPPCQPRYLRSQRRPGGRPVSP